MFQRLVTAGSAAVDPGGSASPSFAVSLDVFAPPPNPVPLPAAAGSGLMTLGAGALLATVRRRISPALFRP
jgi:hypothetical protein